MYGISSYTYTSIYMIMDRIIYYCKINFNNKWLNKIVKLTFEVFGQSK